MHDDSPGSRRHPLRIAATAAPAALAIAVFGTIYGAAARPEIGTPLTLLSSALIFSGALQFAMVGLLGVGAAAPALLLTGAMLNLRHVALGAVLRPRLREGPAGRAGLAWLLTDEAFGFAASAREDTGRTLFYAGICCYLAWQVGTVLGVAGGSLPGLDEAAAAVFPVLFIGLAAIAATSRELVVRTVAGAALTGAIAVALPAARGVAPVIAAVLVALPGGREAR